MVGTKCDYSLGEALEWYVCKNLVNSLSCWVSPEGNHILGVIISKRFCNIRSICFALPTNPWYCITNIRSHPKRMRQPSVGDATVPDPVKAG